MKRLFAISDIHGNLVAFKEALLNAGITNSNGNWNIQDAILVVCGDAIDRGPDSKGVVDLLLKLKKQAARKRSKVHLLLGNHEDMLITAIKEDDWDWFEMWKTNGGTACLISYFTDEGRFDYDLNSAEDIMEIHGDYYNNLEHYVVVNDVLFVHAGINPESDKTSFKKDKAHLWIRSPFWAREDDSFIANYGVKKVVFGHTPTQYITGDKNALMEPVDRLGGKILGIDTGGYYHNGCLTIVEILEDHTHIIAGVGR